MEPDALLDVIQHESTALLAASRAADPTAVVPGCPEWTITQLVRHIGVVHDFWGYVVRERVLDPEGYHRPEDHAGGNPASVFEAVHTFAGERAAELHRVLTETDPATPVWTWSPQQDVAFVVRRVAHETAVHRVDAEQAAGREHRLDPVLAADGIDEFLAFFVDRGAGLDGSLHLHCTDTAGEWTLRPGPDGAPTVAREHVKADVAMRGDANDLLMALWRRRPLDGVDVFGDRGIAERFLARQPHGQSSKG